MHQHSLSQQRCFNHARREAVARCPECRRYFCRECITEHDDRVFCASCLKLSTAKPEKDTRRWRRVARVGQALFSFLMLWFFFFLMGRALLHLPSTFHDDLLGMTQETTGE